MTRRTRPPGFFDRATKGTMQDVLAVPCGRRKGPSAHGPGPPDALAPEHRALDILKDLQQSGPAPTCSTSASMPRR